MRKESDNLVANDFFEYVLITLIVLLLMLVAFFIGAMIGFSLIGDGGNPLEVFNPDMWSNIFRFIF